MNNIFSSYRVNNITLQYLLITLMIFSCFGAAVGASAEEYEYRLSSDDIISITVFNEPDLDVNEARISNEGTVSLPLLGQVVVEGLTTLQIEQKIASLLLDGYLKKPNVTVSIAEYRPFYINGEVVKPGSYPYRKGLTVEKAITLAGGFTERASRKNIRLISEDDQEESEKVSLNEPVSPGDIITVSESFF